MQYGIRLLQEDIQVREYRKLLAGLTGETPLGYAVQIRSETDAKKIREMSAHEKQMRRDWQTFRMKQKKKTATETIGAEQFKQMLLSLAGG